MYLVLDYLKDHKNGEKVLINTFSIDFERCKQDEFNNYLNFIENNLNSLITLEASDFEDLIDAFNQVR